MDYMQRYKKWIESEDIDDNTKLELKNIKDEKEIEDRFYKNLDFGTGGLRGEMAAGTNRMNEYTIGMATQGLANYLKNKYGKNATMAIAYDSRNNSENFAKTAALILCGNGIKVYLFESLRPTPMLSYTIRELKTNGGIVVTASHNPKQYNGYKVYGETGGQLTDDDSVEVITEVNKIEDISMIKKITEEESIKNKLLNYIGEEVDSKYFESIKTLSVRKELIDNHASEINIIYTPIHGSGNIPVRRILKEQGYENVSVVLEQEKPDGNFPTASYPNPEDKNVFKLAIEMAKNIDVDVIFGTDPDCDRIGVVVKTNEGFRVLSGNETGVLLTNYIATSLTEMNKMPKNPTMIKTIVTTEMSRKICDEYGIELFDVLTGFKYIGELMDKFKDENTNSFLLGFEESYGYLSGDFARDKDAVLASMLVAEMSLYYKTKGKSLNDVLNELYKKYGFYRDGIISIEFKGKEGQEKISRILDGLRSDIKETVGNKNIIRKIDYKSHEDINVKTGEITKVNLPKSNVLKFMLEDGSTFVVRPSGTEPKMKIYMSVIGSDLNSSENEFEALKEDVKKIIDKY